MLSLFADIGDGSGVVPLQLGISIAKALAQIISVSDVTDP